MTNVSIANAEASKLTFIHFFILVSIGISKTFHALKLQFATEFCIAENVIYKNMRSCKPKVKW